MAVRSVHATSVHATSVQIAPSCIIFPLQYQSSLQYHAWITCDWVFRIKENSFLGDLIFAVKFLHNFCYQWIHVSCSLMKDMVWVLRIWMLLNCFVCWQLGLVVEFYSMIIVYEFMFSIPICVIRSGSCSCFLLTVPCFHSICFNDEHVKFNCLDIVIGWISWYEYRGTHVSYTTCY